MVLTMDGKGVVMRQEDLREQTKTQKLAKKEEIKLTIVLDLIHVIEYLWKAAYVFHTPSSQGAEDWVSKQLLYILQGKSSSVARSMRS